MPVAARLSLLFAHRSRPRRRTVRYDRSLSGGPEAMAAFLAEVASLPQPGWAVTVHDHYAHLSDLLTQALASSFPKPQRAPRAPYLSAVTWALMEARRTNASSSRGLRRNLLVAACRPCLLAWRRIARAGCRRRRSGTAAAGQAARALPVPKGYVTDIWGALRKGAACPSVVGGRLTELHAADRGSSAASPLSASFADTSGPHTH